MATTMQPENDSSLHELTSSVLETGTQTDVSTTWTAPSPGQHTSNTGFYTQVLVIILCIVGLLANGIALLALIFAKQTKKRMVNVLMTNQLVIDFYSCALLVASSSGNIATPVLVGALGYLMCMTGEMLPWIGINSSVINLCIITVDRYVKIVHSIWHKNHFRPWMTYVGCVFSWASGFAMNFFAYFFRTYLSNDGRCMGITWIWPDRSAQIVYLIIYYLYFFQLPLILFIFCYGRILQVIRRQNHIFQKKQHAVSTTAAATSSASATTTGPSAAQKKASRGRMNTVKTMIFVTTFFVVSSLPNSVYFVISTLAYVSVSMSVWYATMFLIIFNIAANPFIYIFSYDDIRDSIVETLTSCCSVSTTNANAGNNIELY